LSEPDYDTLDARLVAAGVDATLAEAHGLLTGWLCGPAGAKRDFAAFLREQMSATTPTAASVVEDVAEEIGAWTRAQLEDPEFGFKPLLPDDSQGIAHQTEALADWCRGFVYGLAETGARDLSRLPAEVREFLEDMLKLAGAESDAGEAEETEARALAELVEYVRAGVQLVYESLRAADSKRGRNADV
jgi:uncharacterized protein YgfB (UPF0149 family)